MSRGLTERSAALEGSLQGAYRAVGQALEVIPRTLAQNCGANVIRTLTKLRAKHADTPLCPFGIDGDRGASSWTHCIVPLHTSSLGTIADMRELGVWDAYAVKVQTLKTSVEAATLLLRIDDIVSGISKKKGMAPGQSGPAVEDPDAVDPEAMLPE